MSSDNAHKEFVILHATDVHCDTDRVQELQQWLKDKQQRVDVVLVSGDIANMPMDFNLPEEEVRKHHRDLEEVVASFAPISSNLYYIPGNHDALTTFNHKSSSQDPPSLSPSSLPCNVHMKALPIAEGLRLLGLGGSVPGFQGGTQVWDGFPYRTCEEMGKDLRTLFDEEFFSDARDPTSRSSVILMTHCGPLESDTTLARFNPREPPIVSGSPDLYELLCKEEVQRSVVINIHGHTHHAPGRCQLGKVTVLNPGPLVCGYFGLYTLRSTSNGPQPWQLSSICFHRLSTCSTSHNSCINQLS